jgi:hypothetical protein
LSFPDTADPTTQEDNITNNINGSPAVINKWFVLFDLEDEETGIPSLFKMEAADRNLPTLRKSIFVLVAGGGFEVAVLVVVVVENGTPNSRMSRLLQRLQSIHEFREDATPNEFFTG